MEIQRINPREWNCSAAVFGDLVFLSGTVADDKSLDMKGQTAQVLKKIDAVLSGHQQVAHLERDGLYGRREPQR
jgi:enamine deaminase RidA (YjgF/YER057c/UK114 family)